MEYKPPRRAQNSPVTVICAYPAGVEADRLVEILLDSRNVGDALAALDGEGSPSQSRQGRRVNSKLLCERSGGRRLHRLYRSLAVEQAASSRR